MALKSGISQRMIFGHFAYLSYTSIPGFKADFLIVWSPTVSLIVRVGLCSCKHGCKKHRKKSRVLFIKLGLVSFLE